jgi:hypothetical protein
MGDLRGDFRIAEPMGDGDLFLVGVVGMLR